MNNNYYICQIIGDDEINLIGPFASRQDASDYGACNCSPGGPDDPRWNTVVNPVVRYLPADKPFERGAYGSRED